MNNSVENCGVGRGCWHEVKYACTCGDPVVFICGDCIRNHLSEPSTHLIISLEQARELVRNKIGSMDFANGFTRYNKLKIQAEEYIRRLISFKQEVENFKQHAITLIEQKLDSIKEYLELLRENSEAKLKNIKIRMKSFTDENDELLLKFEARGLGGLIEEYQGDLRLDKDLFQQAIQSLCVMSIPPSQSDLLKLQNQRQVESNTNSSIVSSLSQPSSEERKSQTYSYISQYQTNKKASLSQSPNIFNPQTAKIAIEKGSFYLSNSYNASLNPSSQNQIKKEPSQIQRIPPEIVTDMYEFPVCISSSSSPDYITIDSPSNKSIPIPSSSVISPPSSPSQQHIFIAKSNTKRLIKYDCISANTQEFYLETIVSSKFDQSSTCILPNGKIILVGGRNKNESQVHGNTYIFNPTTGACIKTPSLTYHRSLITLYCNDKNVYAIGGFDGFKASSVAERMDWNSLGWKTLPTMKSPRVGCGSYYYDSKLYLFGGANTSSVEYYDFSENGFYLVNNLTVPQGENVVGVIDDRVYVINQHLTVLTQDLKILAEVKNIIRSGLFNISDVVVRGKTLIFYGNKRKRLYSFNSETYKLNILSKI
jgi:hypothetical protein